MLRSVLLAAHQNSLLSRTPEIKSGKKVVSKETSFFYFFFPFSLTASEVNNEEDLSQGKEKEKCV
jgi:hypothetical protein